MKLINEHKTIERGKYEEANRLAAASRSRPSPWTRRWVTRLKARWAAGATAKEISEELAHGISRSAVLSAVHRFGIVHLSPFGGRRGRRRKDGKRGRAGDRRLIRATAGRATGRRACAPAAPPAPLPGNAQPQLPAWVRNAKPYVDDPRVDADVPLSQRRSFLELDSSTCRWPVGDPCQSDFFFCGARPLEGKPYCAAHDARAYQEDTHPRPWRIRISPCRQTR
jgi:GcrA cell cycle regulator